MNKQLMLAVAFVVFASIQIESKPLLHTRLTAPAQQQKLATKTAKIYACPMHPDVKSTRKGKCPKCKMDLQPVPETTNLAEKDNPVASVMVGDIVTADVNTSAAGNVSGPATTLRIPDVEVLDQEGHVLRFYRDLIKGKTVAINFIFTNCTTICPPLAATFARVQKEMADKVGKDVHFISISVDPVTDTPERLKAWGTKFNAGAGWTFVTGSKPEMDKLLNGLGASVARREDHSPAVIVGNDLKSVWTRTYGLAQVSQLVGLIENVIEAKSDESQALKETTKP